MQLWAFLGAAIFGAEGWCFAQGVPVTLGISWLHGMLNMLRPGVLDALPVAELPDFDCLEVHVCFDIVTIWSSTQACRMAWKPYC